MLHTVGGEFENDHDVRVLALSPTSIGFENCRMLNSHLSKRRYIVSFQRSLVGIQDVRASHNTLQKLLRRLIIAVRNLRSCPGHPRKGNRCRQHACSGYAP